MQKYHHTTITECAQAGTINSIQQLLEQLSALHLEERQERRESEKRIIVALEKVADQGARITNLESADIEIKKDVNLLYGIQREVEKEVKVEDPRLNTLYTFYQLTTSKCTIAVSVILLGLLLIGTINDIVYHTSLFSTLVSKLINFLN